MCVNRIRVFYRFWGFGRARMDGCSSDRFQRLQRPWFCHHAGGSSTLERQDVENFSEGRAESLLLLRVGLEGSPAAGSLFRKWDSGSRGQCNNFNLQISVNKQTKAITLIFVPEFGRQNLSGGKPSAEGAKCSHPPLYHYRPAEKQDLLVFWNKKKYSTNMFISNIDNFIRYLSK